MTSHHSRAHTHLHSLVQHRQALSLTRPHVHIHAIALAHLFQTHTFTHSCGHELTHGCVHMHTKTHTHREPQQLKTSPAHTHTNEHFKIRSQRNTRKVFFRRYLDDSEYHDILISLASSARLGHKRPRDQSVASATISSMRTQ